MAVCQNPGTPGETSKIAGTWMFIPTKNGINRYWSIAIWWFPKMGVVQYPKAGWFNSWKFQLIKMNDSEDTPTLGNHQS